MQTLGLWVLVLVAAQAAQPVSASAEPIRDVLAAASHPDVTGADWKRWKAGLAQLYAQRAFAPLWFDGGTLRRSAAALADELAAAQRRGLRAEDYRADRFAALGADPSSLAGVDAHELALLDVALSLSVARFVSELHAGRIDPRALGFELDVPLPPLDFTPILESLAVAPGPGATAALLDSLEPKWRRFSLLKEALRRYRALAAEPVPVIVPKPPRWGLGAGEPYVGTAALRRLLVELGDLAPRTDAAPAGEGIDADLSAALARFQARHGLAPTGELDERTHHALSVPLQQRVRQIELTLERLRWLPPQLASPPLVVNIPQFKLFAFYTPEDREDAIVQIDVIVGREAPLHNTPVFAADMQYVVFGPYWDVPHGILVRELLPEIQADPDWVRNKGYEVVWTSAGGRVTQEVDAATIAALSSGRARLRQLPGPQNALGRIKFVFPNRYSVYLHDTPASSLFAEARRAFSHGCIRVSAPVTLAEYVLRANPGWTRQRILEAMETGGARRVDLAAPIRVFIVYATALVAEDGAVYFFEDLYGHDTRLQAALQARTR